MKMKKARIDIRLSEDKKVKFKSLCDDSNVRMNKALELMIDMLLNGDIEFDDE